MIKEHFFLRNFNPETLIKENYRTKESREQNKVPIIFSATKVPIDIYVMIKPGCAYFGGKN